MESEQQGEAQRQQHQHQHCVSAPLDSADVTIDRTALYSMGALTKLSAADMQLILQHYRQPGSNEQYVRHCELTGGLSNSNYRLDTSERTLLCKVCDEKTRDALDRQVAALVQLQRHQLPIAYAIARTDIHSSSAVRAESGSDTATSTAATATTRGTTVAAGMSSQPHSHILSLPPWKPIVVYQYLHGSPPTRVTEAVIEQIGAVGAASHCARCTARIARAD